VIAVGRTAMKLEKAARWRRQLELGAEFVVRAAEGSAAGQSREMTGGAGANVVFESSVRKIQ
jgi:NADPH:quinone reductase-like Zn-dependent oxidoreductase